MPQAPAPSPVAPDEAAGTPPADRPEERTPHEEERNPGIPLDLGWIRHVAVNRSAVERRVATLPKRRTVKKDHQAGWLLRAITLMDLTTLAGDDTEGRVARLCAKAIRPVRNDLLRDLGVDDLGVRVAAVCVYHRYVEAAVRLVRPFGLPVAAVSTGFPAGLSPFEERVAEIHRSVEAGAEEIDIVITRAHVLQQRWDDLYEEVRVFREACGPAHLKTILATGELGTLRNVARASVVCMMAGADFIKTSTGKEGVNATLPVGLVMVRAIRDYLDRTGHEIGFKPAGGIRTSKEALSFLMLMKEELGDRWLRPDRFRFGASSLLADIERQLEHHVTGRYSAFHRHPQA